MNPYSLALIIFGLVCLAAGVDKIRPGLIALGLLCGMCAWFVYLLPAQALGR